MDSDDTERMLAQTFPMWDRLSQKARSELLSGVYRKHFPAGMHIHGGGDECAGVLIVESGVLRVYFLSDEGREITLFRVHRGETCLLSASCALQFITFDVFIDAQTDTDLLVIPSPVFNELMEESPYVEAFAYRQLAERFSEVMWVMQQVLFVSFDKRLADYLISESIEQNGPIISTTHDRIARDLGSAREVVSRMLKYFERENLIQLGRGTITLRDERRLRKLAD